MKVRTLLLTLALAALPAVAQNASDKRLAEPFLDDLDVPVVTFGDEGNVRLLSSLMADEDPGVRDNAVRNLGQTHNILALPIIDKAAAEPSVNVRVSAMAAAAELGMPGCDAVVIKALSSAENRVLMQAMDSARKMQLKAAAAQIQPLLANADPAVQTSALETLTLLKAPATPQQLKALLKSPSVSVRLRAAENAACLEKLGDLLMDLMAVAGNDTPAVRAAALASLGSRDFPAVKPLLAQASKDADPMVRRGALWACQYGRQGPLIAAYLNDESPMVRLAAIRAAGELKWADCIEKVMELTMAAPDDETHLAGRAALLSIGTDKAAQTAGKTLGEQIALYKQLSGPLPADPPAAPVAAPPAVSPPAKAAPKASAKPKTPAEQKAEQEKLDNQKKAAAEAAARARANAIALRNLQKRLTERNVASCCRLLGEFRSKEAYDLQLDMLNSSLKGTWLNIACPFMAECTEALGLIGDKQVVPQMIEMLGAFRKNGQVWLQCQLSMSPCPVPYDPKVNAKLILGLGHLQATEAENLVLENALVKVSYLRLHTAAWAAAKTAPQLATDSNRDQIAKAFNDMLSDKFTAGFVQFEIATAAGKLKLQPLLPGLQKLLNTDRPGRILMGAAAWGIQEITGATPAIPDPQMVEGDWWIIRKRQKE